MRQLAILAIPLVACGGHSAAPDASPLDAGLDASTTAGLVDVYVHAQSGEPPTGGAHVMSFDADGAWGERTATDAAGHASLRVEPGGTVVTVIATDAEPMTWQVEGVQPGDTLVVGDPLPPCEFGTPAGTMNVDLPPVTGATTWTVMWPGGSSLAFAPGPFEITVDECAGASFPIFVEIDDNNTFTPLGFSGDVYAFSAGSTVTIPAPTSFDMLSLDLAGIPTVDYLNAGQTAWRLGWSMFGTQASIDPTGTTAQVPLYHAAPYGDAATAWAHLFRANSQQHLETRIDPGATATSLDLASLALPWVNITLHDPTGHLVWNLSSTSGYDGTILDARYSTSSGPCASSCRWVSVAPPGTLGVDFPSLPHDLLGFMPVGGPLRVYAAKIVDSPTDDDYASFRASPSAYVFGDTNHVLPPDGETVRESWAFTP